MLALFLMRNVDAEARVEELGRGARGRKRERGWLAGKGKVGIRGKGLAEGEGREEGEVEDRDRGRKPGRLFVPGAGPGCEMFRCTVPIRGIYIYIVDQPRRILEVLDLNFPTASL
jgi:hypothetical protein